MITVITLINSLEFLQNAINNFEAQNFKDKQLVLIVNGELENYTNNKYKCISTKYINISHMRNLGLEYAKETNSNIFSFFDSDDWYGEEYLTEAFNKLNEGYDIVGKIDINIKYNKDIYSLINVDRSSNIVSGPTITGWLTDKRFDVQYHIYNDDSHFVWMHDKIGYTSIHNFIYTFRENSIQSRKFENFLEGFKFVATNRQSKEFIIKQNSKIIWKYGDGFEIYKLIQSAR